MSHLDRRVTPLPTVPESQSDGHTIERGSGVSSSEEEQQNGLYLRHTQSEETSTWLTYIYTSFSPSHDLSNVP